MHAYLKGIDRLVTCRSYYFGPLLGIFHLFGSTDSPTKYSLLLCIVFDLGTLVK